MRRPSRVTSAITIEWSLAGLRSTHATSVEVRSDDETSGAKLNAGPPARAFWLRYGTPLRLSRRAWMSGALVASRRSHATRKPP